MHASYWLENLEGGDYFFRALDCRIVLKWFLRKGSEMIRVSKIYRKMERMDFP
jgi:hypothetical protein